MNDPVTTAHREQPWRDDDAPRQFALASTGSSLLPYAAVLGAVLAVVLEVGDRWPTPLGRMVIAAVALWLALGLHDAPSEQAADTPAEM